MTEQQMNRELGQRIRSVRKARKMTQGKLAKAIRSSTPNIGDMESGKNGVRLWRLIQIAAVLDVEPWALLHPSWKILCNV